MAYIKSFAALLVIFAFFQNSEAIRCWSCSSDVSPGCNDYFNATTYSYYRTDYRQSIPTLNDCSQGQNNFYSLNQRQVCLKKKIVSTYGGVERVNIVRQCQFVNMDVQAGRCPNEISTSTNRVDFCEYCDYDGCNGANTIEKSAILYVLVPLAMYFYLRK